MVTGKPVSVLFVCLGNICRSPTAKGVFDSLVEERGLAGRIVSDSAGTGHWHVGKAPDPRALEEARLRGIDISGYRARQVAQDDFERFDYLMAMDTENYLDLIDLCPAEAKHKICRFTDYAVELGVNSVPDPYYGGIDGFVEVYEIVEACSRGLLEELIETHGLK